MNGFGGYYFDCAPLASSTAGGYTETLAREAAASWSASGMDGSRDCNGSCVTRLAGNQCGVVCWGGQFVGRAVAGGPQCDCPGVSSGFVGDWN
jgi:hypothetical protein